MLSLETPQNRCGGLPLQLDYLSEVSRLIRSHGVALHLDGARLFNAAVALGVSAAEIAKHADTVQICLSKGLCAPIGSVLVGDRVTIAAARRMRKMLGGGMRQAGMIAACGIVALTEMTERLADDHARAARLARGLSRVPGVRLDPGPPLTNMVFFKVRDDRYTTRTLIEAARRRGIKVEELGTDRIRAVTHAGVDDDAIDRAITVFTELLGPTMRPAVTLRSRGPQAPRAYHHRPVTDRARGDRCPASSTRTWRRCCSATGLQRQPGPRPTRPPSSSQSRGIAVDPLVQNERGPPEPRCGRGKAGLGLMLLCGLTAVTGWG